MRARAESNVGWLIFILRAMRRREHFRLPGGSEGPAGGLTDDSLQTRVRERLEDGRLFLAGGASLVRRGTTRPCDVCGQAIPKHEIEHEVEQAPSKGRPSAFALAHADCFRLWREESRKLRPPGPWDRATDPRFS